MYSPHKMSLPINKPAPQSTMTKIRLKKKFNEYMAECRVEKGCEYTHTSLAGGSYYVCSDSIDEFMELYTAVVNAGIPVHLTEKHLYICPVVIDLDFRQTEKDRKYTKDHIERIITELMHVIDMYIEVPTHTDIFVLEKPAPRKHGAIYKDGIHIMIPDIVTLPNFQKHLRKTVLPTLENILENCNYLNSVSDIYDEAVIEKNNWLLYGSNKPDEGTNKWTVTNLYQYINGTLQTLEPVTDNTVLIETLSIRNKYHQSKLKMEIPEDEDDTKSVISTCTTNVSELTYMIQGPTQESFEFVQHMVELLSPKRADNYNDWMRVGWCLHNISPTQPYLNLWITFSRNSSKFNDGECEKLWRHMRNDGLTIGSLCRWAKEDSPKEYEQCKDKVLTRLIILSATGSHYDVACVIHHMYQDIYASVTKDKNTMRFAFKGHKWEEESEWGSLRKRISQDVVREYCKVAKYLTDKAKTEENKMETERLLDIAKKLYNITVKLRSTPYKSNIIKECSDLFARSYRDFYEKLDSKTHLIGFDNGVYDLDQNIFREGRPEDLITLTTNYDFQPKSNLEIRKVLEDFFVSITISILVKDFLLDILAYCLHGDKKHQDSNLMFWNGIGANGKSVIKNLCMLVFGMYGYEPSPTVITCSNNDSSKATPEMARIKGVRFLCMSEPEAEQRLQVSLIKRLTGGDRIQTRELFKSNIEFVPHCVVFILMNNKPSLNDFDNGICRRLNILDFPFKFVDTPLLPHERPINPNLDNLFKRTEYLQEFMLMLIERYTTRINGLQSIPKPQVVKDETTNYLNENNIVRSFILEKIDITNNNDDFISSSEMLKMFKKMNPQVKKAQSWFNGQMALNGLKLTKKTTRGRHYNNMVYFGVKEKSFGEDCEIVDEL